MEEEQGVQVDSPTTNQDVNQESSPEAPVEVTTTKTVQEEEQQTPFHEHPRWKELQEEKRWLKEQLALANSRPIAPNNQQPTVQDDPYAGMTAEEKSFYQKIEDIADRKARKIVAEKEAIIGKELTETRQIMATVAYERFQSKHPDVLPNSPEEAQIAQLYQRGYSLEDAYKVAMFEKVTNQKAQAAQVRSNQKVQQKIAANVETANIPANSGLPQQKKMSIRDFVDQQIAKGAI